MTEEQYMARYVVTQEDSNHEMVKDGLAGVFADAGVPGNSEEVYRALVQMAEEYRAYNDFAVVYPDAVKALALAQAIRGDE